MIPYIDARLQAWARWSVSGGVAGGSSMLQRLMDCQGVLIRATAGYEPHLYVEEQLTDKAVASLIPELRKTVEASYLRQFNEIQKLSYCGCSRATYFRRLDHAHTRIMDFVNAYDEHEEVKKRLTLVRLNDSICDK